MQVASRDVAILPAMDAVLRLCLLTHRDARVAGADVARVVELAQQHGIRVTTPASEAEKHSVLAPHVETGTGHDGSWQAVARTCDLVLVLAGDGTLLRVLSALADGPPVLGVNYGLLGYLSGLGHRELERAIAAVAAGDFRTVDLPLLRGEDEHGTPFVAGNDVVASGGVTGRIIEVAWRIVSPAADGGEHSDTMGIVPCDGMVLATPVGSTAYNLSNGGPILAWGVGGFVVSFIAPHTLAARPLVVAPDHIVELEHLGRGADLQLFADGEQVGTLGPGQRLRVGIAARSSTLALVDDVSFYARYRDSFAAEAHEQHARRPRSLPVPPNSGGMV